MILLILAACGGLGAGARPMTAGDGFFDRPWPSDDRLVDGHPDPSGFPGEGTSELLDAYLAEIAKLDGFGTTAPIYQRFRDSIDTALLPDAAHSASTDAAVFLVDVDPASPERGRLVPYTWDWQEDATNWQPSRLLAVQPVWGVPLRPHTRYALVFTTDLARPVRALEDAWDPTDPDHARYADLAETLLLLGVPTERVAWATVFTTQDTVSEMASIARATRETLPKPPLDQVLDKIYATGSFAAYEGELWLPIWQHGESPYLTEGGGFAFDADGWPELDHWEKAAFVVSVPLRGQVPENGWPTAIYAHGTGGDATIFADSASRLEPAAVLARHGMAGVSISLPFHGDRNPGGDPALLSFNYSNPTAGRTNFRQAAMEQVYLAELLAAGPHDLVGEDGREIPLDPDRIAYIGHSHGGEIGALAIPFFGETVRAAVLSGTGGGLTLSVVYRDAGDFDVQGLLQGAFDFAEGEELDETHPLVGMVQLLSEATDPINAAPFWHAQAPWWDTAPQDVLMFEGLQDIYTPPVAIEALAGAGGQPLLEPVVRDGAAQEALDTPHEALPTSGNVLAWDGSAVSAGLAQYEDQGHFAIFDDSSAAELYGSFLESAMSGTPVLEER